MKVVLHSFGNNQRPYLQSTFLIINLLQYRNEIDSINVITENPLYYKKLENYITIIPVNENTINSWKGETHFTYRIKLKAIELMSNLNPGDQPLLYLDNDTFSYNGITDLKNILLSGKGIMHNNEGRLSENRTRSASRLWKGIRNQTFAGITPDRNDCMWNAGVIGLPAGKSHELIDSAIRMCDDMCIRIPVMFLIEQFCVSVAMQRLVEVQPAKDWIGHYWGNRFGWTDLIATFIAESYMKDYTVEEDIERMGKFNFGQIPIALIPTNTERKLHTLINNIFKPKVSSFLR